MLKRGRANGADEFDAGNHGQPRGGLVPPPEDDWKTSQRLPVILWRRNESALELDVVARVELSGAIGSPPFQKNRFLPRHFDNIHSSNRSIGRALSVANNWV